MWINSEQEAVLASVKRWWTKGESNSFLITGCAGTGKTRLIGEIIRWLRQQEGKTVGVGTPTWQSLYAAIDHANGDAWYKDVVYFKTVHSILGYAMEPSDNGEQRLAKVNKCYNEDVNVLVIDEAFYLNNALNRVLLDQKTPRVLIGDPDQLLPIGDKHSILLTEGIQTAQLKTVMRNDDPKLLALAHKLRLAVNRQYTLMMSDLKPFIVDSKAWMDGLVHSATGVGLTWKAKEGAVPLNRAIRERLMPGVTDQFIVGDRIMMHSPYITDDVFLHNNERVAIVSVKPMEIPVLELEGFIPGRPRPDEKPDEPITEFPYQGYGLMVESKRHGIVPMLVLDRSAETRFKRDMRRRAAYVDSIPEPPFKSWLKQKYWRYRNMICIDWDYCKAMSTHRSQGSEYDDVWIDAHDIHSCRDFDTMLRLMYVAFTRGRKHVYIKMEA